MATLIDGLGGEELSESGLGFSGAATSSPYFPGSLTVESQISGANIYSTTDIVGENVYGDTVVSGLTVKGATFTQTDGNLRSASVGSAYGMQLQAGSHVLTSNGRWVEFPVGFTSNTGSQIICMATNIYAASKGLSVSEVSLGSFYVSGGNSSDTFNWIAVGI